MHEYKLSSGVAETIRRWKLDFNFLLLFLFLFRSLFLPVETWIFCSWICPSRLGVEQSFIHLFYFLVVFWILAIDPFQNVNLLLVMRLDHGLFVEFRSNTFGFHASPSSDGNLCWLFAIAFVPNVNLLPEGIFFFFFHIQNEFSIRYSFTLIWYRR